VDITSDGAGGYFVSDDYARVIYRLSRDTGLQSAAVENIESIAHATTPQTLDTGMAAAGAELYLRLPCAECHAPTALTPVLLSNLGDRYSLVELTDYFLTPTPPMPLFELDLEQRMQLAQYLLSQAATEK
jgi:mono/diheme cytochrome c family protein